MFYFFIHYLSRYSRCLNDMKYRNAVVQLDIAKQAKQISGYFIFYVLFIGITNAVNEFKDLMSSDPSSSLLSDKEKHVSIYNAQACYGTSKVYRIFCTPLLLTNRPLPKL